MSSAANDDDTHSTIINGQPVHTDKTAIIHKGNDANIPGTIHSLWQWCVRTSNHVLLISQHSVSDRGYIYIDDTAAITFINDKIGEKHDATNPAPPTATRVRKMKVAADVAHAKDPTASPLKGDDLTFATAIPAGTKTYSVNPTRVNEAKSALLTSLGHIFSSADWFLFYSNLLLNSLLIIDYSAHSEHTSERSSLGTRLGL